ncbi:Macrolide export ATP-binding/permease protein MacB [Halioglobus japonicus]|nr:Macrolide export ATP-binding/permease protein MacB [Halioglobus japonicus]
MTAILEVEDITKIFRSREVETPVLNGVSFKLQAGELVALLGPSGSGKSTLLSIVGLLLSATAGRMSLLDQDVTHLKEDQRSQFRNRHLGFVFQAHHLLPDFTARENVAFPAAAPNNNLSRAMRERAGELLERVGLADRVDYLSTQLSGGQKQRVAIARALMNKPNLVLADEPTGNLDRETGFQVMEQMKIINREERTTFLISTHDPEIAARCDYRIQLLDGKIDRID